MSFGFLSSTKFLLTENEDSEITKNPRKVTRIPALKNA